MGRALNKNKKPGKKTIRARNYFLGSFGSPCSFCPPQPACASSDATAYTILRVNARIPAHHAAILRFWPNIPSNSASHAEEAVPVVPSSRTWHAPQAHHA
ncbi:hypothetical protein PspR32_22225 [Pseudomonas sp. R32]|nr:hypothetical protein PspR32_22225 [Pseudomonas sp. R32]